MRSMLCCLLLSLLAMAAKAGDEDSCSLPIIRGRCRAAFRRWAFDSKTGNCIRFIYGGCGGNSNQFKSEDECKMSCAGGATKICKLPITVGPCEAAMPSWGFNTETSTCQRFNYGGCEGNANRFGSQETCKKLCGAVAPEVSVCKLPLVKGPCEALGFPWGYDAKTGVCRTFEYGGCQGNGNRFGSRKECANKCENV